MGLAAGDQGSWGTESSVSKLRARELDAFVGANLEFAYASRIGQLAVAEGFITPEQVVGILEEQSQKGGLFGEAAVRLRFLTGDQVEHLLEYQRSPEESVLSKARILAALRDIDLSESAHEAQDFAADPNTATHERSSKQRSTNLRASLETINALKPLSVKALDAFRLANAQDSDLLKVAAVIETDPALAARFLRLANSAAFGQQRKVADVRKAVILIGAETTRCLLLSALLLSSTNTHHVERQREIWARGLRGACLSQAIAELWDPSDAALHAAAFSAGLLRDLGEITVVQFLPKFLARIDARVARGESLADAELDELGVSHEDIGVHLANKWNLPKEITEAIWFHHGAEVMIAPLSVHPTTPIVRRATLLEHLDLSKPQVEELVEEVSQLGSLAQGHARHVVESARTRFLKLTPVLDPA